MVSRRLVLASASPARLRLLRAARLDPEVVVSGVREDDVDETDVRKVTAVLAERKALAVAGEASAAGAVVLGCDSLLDFDGTAFAKPASPDVARRRWEAMRGREGHLHTGHHLVDTASGAEVAAVETTLIRFGDPSDAELEAYVATGEPLGVAGGFTLDGYGAPFVAGIDGCHGNVIGLSMPLLRRLLAELGIGITDLWS